MLKKKVPRWLWDYGVKWVCKVMQHTASTSRDLSGQTALEQLTGETPKISEYLDFTFYDWCWYNDNAGLGEMKLGHWLGISHRVGSLMSYWYLPRKETSSHVQPSHESLIWRCKLTPLSLACKNSTQP